MKLATAPARSTTALAFSRMSATKKALQCSRPGYTSVPVLSATGAKDLG